MKRLLLCPACARHLLASAQDRSLWDLVQCNTLSSLRARRST